MLGQSGLPGFESDSDAKSLLVGFAKLDAIRFNVAGGLREVFIFSLVCRCCSGEDHFSMDRSTIPLPLATLCVVGGAIVAITRAALGTSLFLSFFSGQLVSFSLDLYGFID